MVKTKKKEGKENHWVNIIQHLFTRVYLWEANKIIKED